MGKATLIAGLAAGYVLGTRDGRERYEQIKTQANKVMQDPRVRRKAARAQDLAKEKAPRVQEKVTEAAHKASAKAKGAKSSSDAATAPIPNPRHAPEPVAGDAHA